MNLHTFMCSRSQLTMKTGEGERIKLGQEFRSDRVTVTVKPIGSSMDKYKWRRQLEVKTKEGGYPFFINFRIGGRGSDRLCSAKDGCHLPLADCVCEAERKEKEQQAGEKRARQSAAAAAEQRRARAFAGQSAFAAKYAKKHQTPCEWMDQGMCSLGFRCGFIHVGDEADWRQISCRVDRNQSGTCAAHPWCIYKECAEAQAEYRRHKAEQAERWGAGPSS
jgi:hypothetical protein